MKRYQSRKLFALVALAVSMTAIFVACDRAKFGNNGDQPIVTDDLDGGSKDVVVQCRPGEDGTNICLDGDIESEPVNGTFFIPTPTEVVPMAVKGTGYQCIRNTFDDTKRKNAKVNGVELWLVVDSSNSFDIERLAVAEAIVNGFQEACALGVPVRISVIAAHTPESPDSALRLDAGPGKGQPFFSQEGEDRTITIYPNSSPAQLEAAKRDLLVKLDKNMRRDPITQQYVRDNPGSNGHSGADEMGLLALSNTLAVAPRRQDHALAVIMLSDENDVCMAKFNGDPDGHENLMHKTYCGSLSPEGVYSDLRRFAGDRPLVVASIVYSGKRPPVDDGPNDVGRGYLDLTYLAGGRSFELAPAKGEDRVDYIHRMAENVATVTGNMTRRYTKYYPHYPVFGLHGKSIPLSDIRIDPETKKLQLRVIVDGEEVKNPKVDPRYNLVTPAKSGDQVIIEYCTENIQVPACGLPTCVD